MRKNYRISLIISTVMLAGILLSSLFVYASYSKVIKDNTRNVAELSTMNIYSEINNELTKPIYVAVTMANDSFLKEWIVNESNEDIDDIKSFLSGIKSQYNYNSVFMVSSDTLNYYYSDGINKVISPTNDHDIWYYDFLQSSNDYELDVDVDELNGILTIFVNVKIYDNSNNITAVVGVGLVMEHIQEIMALFEEEYDLDVYLVDSEGLVQSNSDTSIIETVNIFSILDKNLEDKILADNTILNTTISNDKDTYIISRLVDEIDWYLLVTKDTNTLSSFFLDYFLYTIIMVVVVITIVVYIVIKNVSDYQSKIYNLAKTDYLTLLLNRRGFDQEYKKFGNFEEALVFIIDIDRFKDINDEYGHTKGDLVLRSLAKILDSKISKYGKLSRWGGDEFTGVMVGQREELEYALESVFKEIGNDDLLKSYSLSISLGYTYTKFDTDLDKVLAKADEALYIAKSKGGKRIESV